MQQYAVVAFAKLLSVVGGTLGPFTPVDPYANCAEGLHFSAFIIPVPGLTFFIPANSKHASMYTMISL